MAVTNTKMKRTDVDRRKGGEATRGDFVTQPGLLQPVTANTDLTSANSFKALNMAVGDLVPVFAGGRVDYRIWNAGDDAFAHGLETTGIGDRFRLKWTAGINGKVGVNGDRVSATEATNVAVGREFEVLGTSASTALVTYDAEGGLVLTTGGTTNNQMILAPHLDAIMSPWSEVTWGTDNEVAWECVIETDAVIINSIIWAGLKLTNTSTTVTDDDQLFFRYQSTVASGAWQAVSSISDTDTATASGVTVAVDTVYHLYITIDADGLPRMYINGALVATGTSFTGDHADLIPYIGVQTTNGTASVMGVRGQAISRAYGA